MIDSTTIQTIAGYGATARPAVPRQPAVSHVLAPEGYVLHDVPAAELPPLPNHIRQAVTLHDAESFGAYVKRYQDPRTLIFAQGPESDSAACQFLAVFDFHRAKKDGDGESSTEHEEPTQPQRCAHRATYPCPYSRQWELWTGIDKKPQSQRDFVDFIDENTPDITAPDSATILQLAMNFEARTEVKFSNKIDRVSGGRKLNYQEEGVTVPGSIPVPDRLKLRIPVFRGGAPYPLDARLEWIARDGRLTIAIHLVRSDEVLDNAFADLRKDIAAATGLEPLTGVPALATV